MQVRVDQMVTGHRIHELRKAPAELEAGFTRFAGGLAGAEFAGQLASIAGVRSANEDGLHGARFLQPCREEFFQIFRSEDAIRRQRFQPKRMRGGPDREGGIGELKQSKHYCYSTSKMTAEKAREGTRRASFQEARDLYAEVGVQAA